MTTALGLWDDWYRHANQFVTGEQFVESTPVTDLIRTQFRILDALVALHAGCTESVCSESYEGHPMTSDEQKLINIETRVAMQVSSVHGYLTASEATALHSLRQRVGKSYDAINRRWRPLDD